jgi:hypothetical protein
MWMMFLICLLVGAALGQRFKVLVLIPTMVPVLLAAAVFARAGTVWQILGAALVATACLEFGYFAGVSIRYLIAAGRVSWIRAKSGVALPSPQPAAD